jgi:transcriptional regulator with GAF, ATPase, and Fis domain
MENELGARLREHRRMINGLSRIGPEGLSPGQLMQHVVAQVSRVTNIERVKIMRYRPERGDLLIEAGVGWKPGVVGNVSLAADYQSPAGRALQTGAAVTLENFASAPEFRIPEVLREHGIVSMVNVPVMINNSTWGVLEVDSTRPQTFDEWDISFLSIVANVLGVCLAFYETKQQRVNGLAEAAKLHAQFQMTLREVQHRIKNNLQIIIAFLSQQMGDAKYAFDNAGGRIRVHFGIISNRSEACVSVADDGKGMNMPPKKGLGLTLVEGFAQQIQGRVEYTKVDVGTKVILCFPVALTTA